MAEVVDETREFTIKGVAIPPAKPFPIKLVAAATASTVLAALAASLAKKRRR